MKLHQQFLLLHSRFGGGDSASTTLDEIAKLLDCTPRNAANIVRAMSRNGWIAWESSRGRGRRSTLSFLAQAEDIAAQAMLQAINRKDVARAIGQIQIHRNSSALQEHLQGRLLSYFGHHVETSKDRQIDTLRIPIRQPLHTVDPLYMNLLAESFVASHVFDGLVRRSDSGDDIKPSIAHAWETDETRTLWTFYLRKEVLFHHGKVLNADDVVYTFERLVRSPRRTLYSFIYKQIKSVRALNPTVVRFELEEPNELFLPFLCTSRAAVVPKDLNQLGSYRFGTEPVGTGPFKVTQMNGTVCVMEAFGPCFQGRAHLDRVEIVHVPWAAEAMAEESGGERAGSADQADQPDQVSPFHVIPNAAAGDSGWSRIHSETTVRKFVTCNTQKAGPLTDPALREHLFGCLKKIGESGENEKSISDKAATESEESSPIPSAQDPVRLRIATILPYRDDAEALAEALSRHGYDCEVAAVSPEEFKGAIRLESDLILFSLLRDQDQELRLYDLYRTMAEHVDAHTRIDIERLLSRALREPDPAVRHRSLDKIESLLIRERHLHILSEKPLPTAYLPTVRGVTFNSQGWVNLRTLWFPPVMSGEK
ncbi:ABC transporter substrate-binding protein [Cohnella sp. CIP 111063]|uniref:ABC transporter substrate-binding protein n=1 Tax=unclassified Cohnella TaxID=2636738 RepID=UPI000B8C2C9B|nr:MULTISPECIES: ABC transporter substrate-binding protein [unclassified Cohnella]OXS57627.1 ABC transporter substrate-binding protein [Cohnella sp. CIP 111063]PRX71005.1 MarR-like DNA-binding transcriptional regulator SgrR of sgrS sRNA [Cohnella sp. SGD-V74]